MKRIFLLLLTMLLALTMASCDDEEVGSEGGSSGSSGSSWFSDAIESETNTRAGEDLDAETATILVYMVASDLESQAGCASTDIEEMYSADLSDNVNVVIQTGGATYWVNENMNENKVERFEVVSGGVKKVDTVGKCKKVSMTDANTLADFLSWGMKNYPADRYGVVLWNHGGGSLMGFGYDEYHPDDMLGIDEIGSAFRKAKAQVDFIGFDACLMGTIETAYVMSDYADYMIASEETEPGTGWYYTNWLTNLSENPGLNMKDLAKSIINDFVDGKDASFWDDMTLALYDLSDCKEAYKELCNYMKDSRDVLRNQGFQQMADARIDTRCYGDNEYEQIDIRSYLDRADVDADELRAVLEDMIVYYNGNISDSTGMAMYYPYSYLDYYSDMNKLMSGIGMNNKYYLGYFNDFVSILAKGGSTSRSTKATTSLTEQLTGETEAAEETNYEEEEWYDAEAAEAGYVDTALFTTDEDLGFTEVNDGFILDLTDEQWNAIGKVEMLLYLTDEDGYEYFGSDSLVSYDENGDLIADFDFQWVTIEDQLVPFYIISDEEDGEKWQATGYVPAILNAETDKEQDIDIYIRWDNEHEDGYVMGYTTYKSDEDTLSVATKNYLNFESGDTLDFYTDFYTFDGEFEDSYYIGETLKLSGSDLKVAYGEIPEDYGVQIGYHLVDKYNNDYWTEILEY